MTALRTTATDRPEEPRMSNDPMAAALARLRAAHPDLPTDGGRVWEPVQDDGEQPTPCSDPPCNYGGTGEPCDRHEVEQAHADGEHEYCGVTCEVQFPTELMRNFILAKGYPGTEGMLDELLRRAAERQPAPADVCQFHSPTGDPCECGCDAGVDCHPRRTA